MSLGASILITAVIAGGLGLFIGWLIGSRKQTAHSADDRLENELRQQLTQRETELGADARTAVASQNFPRHRPGESGRRRKNSR